MENLNLLDFLNSATSINTLEYSTCDSNLVDFLTVIAEEEQFTKNIDLGVLYVSQTTLDQYIIIDGLRRIVSLSLLLHAVCECYKKTTPRNEKAIKTIRTKYLINGKKTKLKLSGDMQSVYEKIIFGERLSGKEKDSAIFQLLHKFWTRIKEEKLQASKIFNMLDKISVYIVNADNVSHRDLHFSLNKNNRNLNQLDLIANYLKTYEIDTEWNEILKVFNHSSFDSNLFFRDFFITKFNFNEFNINRLYDYFTNYFETMLEFMDANAIISKIKDSALMYNKILNVNFDNENIKKALIQIKMHNGEDTYAYLLNIYEDYIDNNITEATFLEILNTINEYLINRQKTPNNVSFNELIQYLNAFISCK